MDMKNFKLFFLYCYFFIIIFNFFNIRNLIAKKFENIFINFIQNQKILNKIKFLSKDFQKLKFLQLI